MHGTRKVDIGLILMVCTIVGMIWAAYAKPASWDQTSKDLQEIKPRVEAQGLELAVLKAKIDDIQEDVKYIKRHTRP